MSRVLVCIPRNPSLPQSILTPAAACLDRLLDAETGDYISCYIDSLPIAPEPTDIRPWSKVTRVRNRMLDHIEFEQWDYLLWIDADVVQYEPKMAARLIAANPEGVTSPLVLIEDSDRFYDFAANIIKGRDHIEPDNRWRIVGRNVQHEYPYWPDKMLEESVDGMMDMDCTGTITMVPSWIYQSGARYKDHPAFTDHYPICTRCRLGGKRVMVDTFNVAYHADLPKHGLEWH